jgi:hypothetical protein
LQAQLAGADAEYEVDPNTVRRNLQILERLGWVARLDGRPPRYRGRSHVKSALKSGAPPPVAASPMRWIPIETFSRNVGETVDDTLSVIHEGHLDGLWLGGQWYVLDLAVVDVPDPRRPTYGRLRIAAECRDNRLFAAPGVLTIDLHFDPSVIDNPADVIENTATALLQDEKPEWITVQLGRSTYRVHRSLHHAIGSALIGWVLELDAGGP